MGQWRRTATREDMGRMLCRRRGGVSKSRRVSGVAINPVTTEKNRGQGIGASGLQGKKFETGMKFESSFDA